MSPGIGRVAYCGVGLVLLAAACRRLRGHPRAAAGRRRATAPAADGGLAKRHRARRRRRAPVRLDRRPRRPCPAERHRPGRTVRARLAVRLRRGDRPGRPAVQGRRRRLGSLLRKRHAGLPQGVVQVEVRSGHARQALPGPAEAELPRDGRRRLPDARAAQRQAVRRHRHPHPARLSRRDHHQRREQGHLRGGRGGGSGLRAGPLQAGRHRQPVQGGLARGHRARQLRPRATDQPDHARQQRHRRLRPGPAHRPPRGAGGRGRTTSPTSIT